MKTTISQFFRFGIVGLFSNLVGYLLYLGITMAGMEHKLAMTLVYIIGVMQGFILNKRWSFRHDRSHGPAFLRYCTIYAIGYLLNLAALYFFSDHLGWPHEAVQASMVILIAVLLFVLQKLWVFQTSSNEVNIKNF